MNIVNSKRYHSFKVPVDDIKIAIVAARTADPAVAARI